MQPQLVTSREELMQILQLQKRNLLQTISSEEMKSQGFVTMHHNLSMLEKMHDFAPSVIIKEGNELVGYALTMFQECRDVVPALVPMLWDRFALIKNTGGRVPLKCCMITMKSVSMILILSLLRSHPAITDRFVLMKRLDLK